MRPSSAPDLAAIARAVRQGRFREARAALKQATRRRPPRADLQRYANLCRRAGLYPLALRLLYPVVRRPPYSATAAEKAEYAAALIWSGAVEEAVELLETLSAGEAPKAILYRAFAKVRVWDYAGSLPLLQACLQRRHLTGYQRLVVRVNVVAALAFERHHEEAVPLLRELIQETSARGARLLCGNLFELSTESLLFRREFEAARATIAQARALLSDVEGPYRFSLDKWEALVALGEGATAGALAAVSRIRAGARASGDWEAGRDCDRYEALFTGNVELARKLVLGTPYPAFRKRFLSELGFPVPLAEYYYWGGDTPEGMKAPNRWLDPRSGESSEGDRLKLGSVGQRCLDALSRDFYRPVPLPALFRGIYPGEWFHPESGPLRVHQTVHVVRRWIAEHRYPFVLKERAGEYSLLSSRGFALRLGGKMGPASRTEQQLERLRARFGAEGFTAKEAALAVGISLRSANRLLEVALGTGAATRLGAGNRASYRLAA